MTERPPPSVNLTDEDWHVFQHPDGYWQIVKKDHGGSIRLNFGKDEEKCRAEFAAMVAHGPCVECGGIQRKLIEERPGLCFTCDHWTNLHRKYHGSERVVIVEGRHHMIEPDLSSTTPSHCAGYGGSKFTIRFYDGREVSSRNLWTQGEIPVHFRERLPDNAAFVTR